MSEKLTDERLRDLTELSSPDNSLSDQVRTSVIKMMARELIEARQISEERERMQMTLIEYDDAAQAWRHRWMQADNALRWITAVVHDTDPTRLYSREQVVTAIRQILTAADYTPNVV